MFALHPMQVESVAWVSERKNVLYSFFYLSSIISYVYYNKNNLLRYYLLSLLLFLFSLFSKTTAITLPVVLLVIDYYMINKINKLKIIEKIPFVVLSCIFGLVGILIYEKVTTSFPLYLKIMNIFYIIVFYVVKFILPINLSIIYENPVFNRELKNSLYFISPIVVFLVIPFIFKYYKNYKRFFFGVFFYLTTISATLQIMPTAGVGIVFDRYMYLPLIGLLYLFVESLYFLKSIKNKNFPNIDKIFVIFVISIIIGFSVLTFCRTLVWKNNFTLWTDVMKKYPKIPVSYNNLGNAYLDIKNYKKAFDNYNKALEINPQYAQVYTNRGNIFFEWGKYKESIQDHSTAIKIKPNLAIGYINRGNVYKSMKEFDMALSDYNKCIEIDDSLSIVY